MGYALIAHICDTHFGARIGRVFPEDVIRWWQMMIEDWRSLKLPVEVALICGDMTMSGDDQQLDYAKGAIEALGVDVCLLPGECDIQHGKQKWIERFGAPDRFFRYGGLNIVAIDMLNLDAERKWTMSGEQFHQLSKFIDEHQSEPLIVMLQPLLRRHEGMFRPPWDSDVAEALLERLKHANVLCVLCSGMHTNSEHLVDSIPVIGTGALCGFYPTGVLPERCILTRPGYRLIIVEDGAVRTFFREVTSQVQVTIVSVGGSHTLGPRPLVNVLDVFGDCAIYVQAYAREAEIVSVEMGLGGSPWIPMRKVWDGLWSEWEGALSAHEVGWGQQLLIARARTSNGYEAFDAIPFWMRSLPSQRATSIHEVSVFELLSCPR
jgi:hypothetical protein